MATGTKQRALSLINSGEQQRITEAFHERMRDAGHLTAVLRSIADQVSAGAIPEEHGGRLFDEAVLMSRPLYPIGATPTALALLSEEERLEAEGMIASLHKEIAGPEGASPHERLTEAQLDPLRFLYERVDPRLLDAMEASPAQRAVLSAVRTQVLELADHLQQCSYLSAKLVARWLRAREHGQPIRTRAEDMGSLVEFAEQVLAPLPHMSNRPLIALLEERTARTAQREASQQTTRRGPAI